MRLKHLQHLPEAEAKVQLALFKLERRHMLKVSRNEQHRAIMHEKEAREARRGAREKVGEEVENKQAFDLKHYSINEIENLGQSKSAMRESEKSE